MRIVSLLPSATEILFAIGAGADVVGVTFECDHPAEARQRTIVSTSALPPGLASTEIDAVVRERLAAGEDLYHLDADALARLDADVVVTQDLCAVCAVDVSEVQQALDYLGCHARVITTDPQTLADVMASITQVGSATGHHVDAEGLVAGLHQRLDAVAQQVAGQPSVATAVLEWIDPPFAPGHWVPEMVERAGGRSVVGEAGQRSVATTWSAIEAAAPELIISAPCGFALEESARLATEVLVREVLPAGIPVWAVDANASFARPGPRLVDGIEALAAIMHPGRCGVADPRIARRLR